MSIAMSALFGSQINTQFLRFCQMCSSFNIILRLIGCMELIAPLRVTTLRPQSSMQQGVGRQFIEKRRYDVRKQNISMHATAIIMQLLWDLRSSTVSRKALAISDLSKWLQKFSETLQKRPKA